MPVYGFVVWREGGGRAVVKHEPCADDEAALERASWLLSDHDASLVVVSRREGEAADYLGAWSRKRAN